MKEIQIKKIFAREIFDSRGNPTVEAEVLLNDGSQGRAIVPSGASTGKYEALELRDEDKNRLHGKGVLKAVKNVNTLLAKELLQQPISNIFFVDKILMKKTKDLGANATLSVSMAFYKALAQHYQVSLETLFGGIAPLQIPRPMLNIINGGVHANNNLDIQEFMIVPIAFLTFKEAMVAASEVYHTLRLLLKEKGYSVAVGDEGGFAPNLKSHEEALDLLIEAIQKANYQPGKDFMIALDAASSEWKTEQKGKYYLPKTKKELTNQQLVSYWEQLCNQYPILSIEDGMDEDDKEGWKMLTWKLKEKIFLVGDDLFVTNPHRLKEGITNQIGNAILIKPNQIGTIYETIQTIQMAKQANYKVILSHRSGESEDTTIASLAFGLQADYLKSGAPCRSERVAKYNELIRIEEKLLEQ